MAHAAVQYRHYDLPWTIGAEQEQLFKRVLRGALGGALALALLLSVLPVPEPDPSAVEEVPPRFARLILERAEPPPPPPPPVVREEPEPLPEPEPVVATEIPDPPPPAEERVVEEPPPAPAPEDRVEQARERARSAGLLPFAEQLSALRDESLLDELAGPTETVSSTATGSAPVAERSLITSRVGTGSDGINTAELSRDTGGSGLAGRTTTRVASPVAAAVPEADNGSGNGGAGGDDRPSRSREEIERVFDQNKGAIYALYNRALRENPSLEGKVVLRLTIAPDGRVTECEIVSSELGDPDLEQKLVQRVMLFRFEAKDVEPITTTKPIDFFPA